MEAKDIEYENIKAMLLEILLENTSSSAVNLWFGDIKIVLIDDNEAVFVTPTDLKKRIITQRFTEKLQVALSQIIGYEPTVTILSSENGEGEIIKKPVDENQNNSTPPEASYEEVRKIVQSDQRKHFLDFYIAL